MESEGSLPCSQEAATGPHPESDKSVQHPHTVPLRFMLILLSHPCLGLPSAPSFSGLRTTFM